MKNSLYYLSLFFILVEACKDVRQENVVKGFDTSIKYELVKDWPQLPDGFKLGNPTGIGIDTDQNIFIFHRAGRTWPLLNSMPASLIKEKTILMLDRRTGKILNSWGDSLFIMPHGLTVDKNNNVWVTDAGLHQIFKFSHEGKLLMKLGEAKITGNDAAHFNRPTDVAVADDGSFYVSDGYINSRVIKFSTSGKYLFEWGIKGDKAGEFNLPHSICLDDTRNVYVADRENSRVQVFDAAGKFLKEFKNDNFGKIYAVTFDTTNKHLLAVDYVANYFTAKGSDFIFLDALENQLFRFGRSGAYEGPVCRYHDVAIDIEGSIYVVDILRNRIQKF